ncbi:MAG: methionyl-tRNA formyltransferase [Capsulimonadaceae bacterium]|nr:methionyl-tRNA formyltransferase [Capsulimonadaceae bacterium]
MRILYFGTSPFAVPALAALLESRHVIIGVVTQPDRPTGRGLQLSLSPVKKAALALAPELPILQPEKARTREFREAAAALEADVFVVAAFGQILSQRLLNTPRYGGINIHGSLLPRWRGAAPMQYCLIEGDAETGVTTMQMDAGMDTGDILLQSRRIIEPADTIERLEEKLSADGAELILETLNLLERGECPRTPQDAAEVTYAPSLASDHGYLDLNRPAVELSHLIRGVTPRPGAFIGFGGKRIKVWTAEPALVAEPRPNAQPGEISNLETTGIIVQTGVNTALKLIEVQPESKAKMKAADWARGARASIGQKFTSLERIAVNGSSSG